MNFLVITLPLESPAAVHLSQGSKLQVSVTPEGLQQVDVMNEGKVVATLSRSVHAWHTHRLAQQRPVRAANEATLRSTARGLPLWWDDEAFLNEPLEELGEFA